MSFITIIVSRIHPPQHTHTVVELKSGMVELKSGMVELKSGMVELKSGMVELKSGIVELKSGMVELKSGMIISALLPTMAYLVIKMMRK